LEDLHLTDDVLTKDNKLYKETLQPYINRYLLEKEIINKILKLKEADRKKLLKDMYDSIPQKSVDSQLLLRGIVYAKYNIEDPDKNKEYLGDDNIKEIIRDLEDITYLVNYFNAKPRLTDMEFINSLTDETKETLNKSLKYKANTLCESLKKWFEDNQLTL
jgi:Glu-tRNA(Gln) amidotransferase subunit E-like FAD-binding protein